jgi:hypothetical protein
MTVRELEARISAAGIVMSRRQLLRHCKSGTFEATKLPAVNNVEEWFIAPASVEKGIADIRALQEQRARRDTTRQDTTDIDTHPGRRDVRLETELDMSGHDATRQDVTGQKEVKFKDTTDPDTTRHVTTSDTNIFEHPYVKKLEDQVEKWQGKYEAQVRRTEDIQRDHQKELIELQRMTAVGNSKTLADFMLQAKDWILGQASPPEKREVNGAPNH